MYSNVEYASWLNATYGLSESIRELVPIRKTPPLLFADPCATVANAATVATTRATGHHFLISILLSETAVRPRSASGRLRRAYTSPGAVWKRDASRARAGACRGRAPRAARGAPPARPRA